MRRGHPGIGLRSSEPVSQLLYHGAFDRGHRHTKAARGFSHGLTVSHRSHQAFLEVGRIGSHTVMYSTSHAWLCFLQVALGQSGITQCEEQAAQGITIVTVTTGGAQAAGRSMSLRFPQERHELLLAARQRQRTAASKALYRLRSGVAGTCSRDHAQRRLRHARYRGFPKTHLQHILTAVATNFLCFSNGWMECRWSGHAPRSLLPSPLSR